jgi:NAD(P)-dependent dehydrogenase (short-subunit alcohol dehydrogenase family)
LTRQTATGCRSRVRQAAARVGQLFSGRLDVLVNNAGVNGKCTLIKVLGSGRLFKSCAYMVWCLVSGLLVKDMVTADFEHTLRVNLVGTMLVCREMLPLMEPHGSGAIVNVASNVGKRGLPLRSDDVASKWALLGFTQVPTSTWCAVPLTARLRAACCMLPMPADGCAAAASRCHCHCNAHASAYSHTLTCTCTNM